MSTCLKHIKGDYKAYPIFHNNHILTTTVLKHGWKTYRMENNITHF